MSDIKGEYCEVCGKFVSGFEYQMCCDGTECNCMGMPIDPCVCSDECLHNLIKQRKEVRYE